MFEWTEDAADAPTRSPRRPATPAWVVVVLVVLAGAWLVVGTWLGLRVLGDLYDRAADLAFYIGEAPAWHRDDGAAGHAVQATLAATVLPGLGLLVALAWRRPVAAAVFGAGAVLGLVLGLWAHAVLTPDAPDVPAPEPRHCQEHSGGDATCPGG